MSRFFFTAKQIFELSPLLKLDMKPKLAYTGIRVKNLEESVNFYTKLFGMKEGGRNTIEVTKGIVVGLRSEENGMELELNYYERGSEFDTPYSAGEGLDHLAFQVEDLSRFKEEAKKAGYNIAREIKSKTSEWAYIEDPNGIWIEVFS